MPAASTLTRPDRLLALVLHLHGGTWHRAADLAETLSVSTRTIYRDVQALQETGLPVTAVPGIGYRLPPDRFLPPLGVSTSEALALLLAGGSDTEAAEVPTEVPTLAGLRSRLRGLLPASARTAAPTARLPLPPADAFEPADRQTTLQVLREALAARRAVRARLRDQAPRRTLYPYALVPQGDAWQLVARDAEAGRIDVFACHALADIERTDTSFVRPRSYEALPAEAAGDPGDRTVRLLFAPAVAAHAAQVPDATAVEERTDGLLVTLHVRRPHALLPWLLSWGAHVRVLEPLALRERLAEAAARAAAHHRPATTSLFS